MNEKEIAVQEKEDKRKKFTNKFFTDLCEAIITPKSAKDVINWIDKIFLKLQRLIKGQQKNQPNNEFQKEIFIDTCSFIEGLEWNFQIRNIHNSIPNISIEEYRKLSLWWQVYNNIYKEQRDFDYNCKWASCSHRIITLYEFFNALKKAWLNIDISIYRFNNLTDDICWCASGRHAWLVLHFFWNDYMIDYNWMNEIFSGRTIQSVNSLKECAKIIWWNKNRIFDWLKKQYREINQWRKKDTIIAHYSSLEPFLDDDKKYPSLRRISFVTPDYIPWKLTRLDYEFFFCWLYIEIWDYQRFFLFKERKTFEGEKEHLFDFIVENIDNVNDEYWKRKVNEKDKEEVRKLLNIVKNDVNFDVLMDEYTSKLSARKTE